MRNKSINKVFKNVVREVTNGVNGGKLTTVRRFDLLILSNIHLLMYGSIRNRKQLR